MARIEKLQSARIKQEKLPFTTHLNCVLQRLTDPIALAVWCYLTSLPPNFKIYRSFLMKHFGLGRDRIGKALTLLSDLDLLVYVQERDEKGVFTGAYIEVKAGFEFQEKLSTGEVPALLKTRATENPGTGETAPIKEIKNYKENKNQERLSPDFFPSKETSDYILYVKKYSADEADFLLAKFMEHFLDSDKVDSDWDKRCYNWFKGESRQPGFKSKKNTEVKCTVPDFFPEKPTERTTKTEEIARAELSNIMTQLGKPNGLGKTLHGKNNGRIQAGSSRTA